jgi:predicted alpha/beta-hydrolase family hydrolase
MTPPDLVFNGPADAPLTIALAHGAGAPMDSPFMAAFAEGLAAEGFRVARFEFPYMVKRRLIGTRRLPDRAPVLLDAWRAVIAALGPGRLVIGGKSLGGRMASLVADETGVRGLVCLGFPFHAPGKPATERIGHMANLVTPTLILQGERDTLGNAHEVAGYDLSGAVRVHWLADGDHGFKPRRASGLTEGQNWDEAMAEIAKFVSGL